MTAASPETSSNQFDVAIIGAGIVGLAVARELLLHYPGLRMVILEREHEIARHQSGHNSGVIHSGIYYLPGSLKARLCVEGAELMYAFCNQYSIPYERCGKLIVALDETEIPRLDELERRGRLNGVSGLRRLSAAEITDVEPGCQGVAALHCPSTGIVDYREVCRVLGEELKSKGVVFHFGEKVTGLERTDGTTQVRSENATFNVGFAIGCAGLWSDRLAISAGEFSGPRIVPFRGAYLTLKPSPVPLVRGLIYPVPNPELPFLGVHITKLINGDVVLGPTAMLVLARDAYTSWRINPRDLWGVLRWPGTWKLSRKYWRTGVKEIFMKIFRGQLIREASNYLPTIRQNGVRWGESSGVRAQALDRDGTLLDDFLVTEAPGSVHVRNAPSPAATSSLALAREIVARVQISPDWKFHESR